MAADTTAQKTKKKAETLNEKIERMVAEAMQKERAEWAKERADWAKEREEWAREREEWAKEREEMKKEREEWAKEREEMQKSIAGLENKLVIALGEKDAAIRVAERAVITAIKSLGPLWSVPEKTCALNTSLECLTLSCPRQGEGTDDGQDYHSAGTGRATLVYRSQWHDCARCAFKPARARKDSDRLGEDCGIADAWFVLNLCPEARTLRELTLKFYMLLGLKEQSV